MEGARFNVSSRSWTFEAWGFGWWQYRVALEGGIGRSWAEQLHWLHLDRLPLLEEVGCVQNQVQDDSQESQ